MFRKSLLKVSIQNGSRRALRALTLTETIRDETTERLTAELIEAERKLVRAPAPEKWHLRYKFEALELAILGGCELGRKGRRSRHQRRSSPFRVRPILIDRPGERREGRLSGRPFLFLVDRDPLLFGDSLPIYVIDEHALYASVGCDLIDAQLGASHHDAGRK